MRQMPLRVLILERSESAAVALVHELERGGYAPEYVRVDEMEALAAALRQMNWDVALVACRVSGLAVPEALRRLRESKPDLPAIIVAGAEEENTAVDLLQCGARDYLLRENLRRLVPAIRRELEQATVRRLHRQAEVELKEHREALDKLVCRRTEELEAQNLRLLEEIAERRRLEEEHRRMFELYELLGEQVVHERQILMESERRYRAVGDTVFYGIWVRDADGTIQYLSQSFLNLIQMSLEEARQTGWMHLVPPEEATIVQDALKRCLQNGETIDLEYRIRDPQGELRTVLNHGYPVRNESGAITSWAGINFDITDRKRMERQLEDALQDARRLAAEAQEGRRILEALMEHIPEGIIITEGPDAVVRMTSRYGKRLLGWHAASNERMTFLEYTQPLKPKPAAEETEGKLFPLFRAVGEGEVVNNEEWIVHTAAGSRVQTLVNAGPIRDAEGRITGGIMAWRDITDFKRAETERERLFARVREMSYESQHQADEMNTVFNSMAEPLLIYEGTGRISKANAAAIEALGFEPGGEMPEEFEDRVAFYALKSERREPWVASLSLRGEVVRDRYYRMINANGQESVILVSAAPICSWDQVQGAVVVWHDMTVSMRMEELLRRSQERYRFLYDESPAFNLIIGLDQTIKDINKSALQELGYQREEMLGRSVLDFAAEKQRFKLAEAIEGRPLESLDIHIRAKDGALHTIMLSPGRTALYDHHGSIAGIIFTGIDVTQRKKAEEALRRAHDNLEIQVAERTADLVQLNWQLSIEVQERKEAEKQARANEEILERIFANTHFMIVYMDTQFNIIRVNQAYAAFDGRDVAFYNGRNHFRLFPDEETQRGFERTVRTGEPFIAYERPFGNIEQPERRVRYWDWTLQPVKNPAGEVESLILILVDVTKRKLAEQELNAAQIMLHQAQRMSDIGTLAASVAHELRNPLGVIRTALYNIKRKQTTGDLSRHIANIEKKIAEGDQIINNLLTYSRIKSPQYEPVQIFTLLEECLTHMRQAVERETAEVEIRYPAFPSVEMEADPVQLREIFNNLLNNAYQALQNKDGVIQVESKQEAADGLEIMIQDNGCGIDPEDLERVFDPFFTTKSKGTGLGLTICKELVHLHGGQISISSRKDAGTEVTVFFPLKRRV